MFSTKKKKKEDIQEDIKPDRDYHKIFETREQPKWGGVINVYDGKEFLRSIEFSDWNKQEVSRNSNYFNIFNEDTKTSIILPKYRYIIEIISKTKDGEPI